jgi:hypothetical protein
MQLMFRFHKKAGISFLTERLLTSQKDLVKRTPITQFLTKHFSFSLPAYGISSFFGSSILLSTLFSDTSLL